MGSFEEAWERVMEIRGGDPISAELGPLLKIVHDKFTIESCNLQEIKISLENLLFFLTTTSGRTTANCFATDLFFSLHDWGNNVNWEKYPEILTDIIGDMGGALHDTVTHPEIASLFFGLPEDLLHRIREWKPE